MKKIDTKDVIAVVDGSDLSELRFGTKDGEQGYIMWEPLEDGTRFIVLDDGFEVEPFDSLYKLTDIYGADEKEWESEANDMLAHCNLKLSDYHRVPVVIEDHWYDDGWYELQTI